MKKELFKVGDRYRICDNCGEWVPADQARCDNCHEHVSNYDFCTVQEKDLQEADMVGQADGVMMMEGNRGRLQCMICDTIVEAGVTLCPNCGNSSLIPMDSEEVSKPDEPIKGGADVSYRPFDTEQYPAGGTTGNTQFFNAVEKKEETSFYFEGEILTGHGAKLKSRNQIHIGPEEIVLGRKYFIENRELFFDGFTPELEQRFRVISAECAVIYVHDNEMTIRKCRSEASRVIHYSVNPVSGAVESQQTLEGTQEYVIKPGDCVEFGNGEDHHRHIMLRFGCSNSENGFVNVSNHNSNGNDRPAHTGLTDRLNEFFSLVEDRFNSMDQQNKNIEKQLGSMQEALSSVEQIVGKFNIEDLALKIGESQAEYDKRLVKQVPQAEAVTKEQEIRNFLKVRLASGNTKDCSHQYEVIKDRQQIVDYLWQAAFYEKVCNAQYEIDKEIDYSVVVNCIGRAFEEYICTYLLQIIYASQRADFEKEMRGAKVKLDSIPQGRICNYLLFYDKLSNGQKVFRRVNKVVEAAGYGNDNNRRNEFRNAVENAKLATQNRNEGSHAGASKHTSMEEIEKYMKKNQKEHISKKEYMDIKAKVFGEKTLSTLKSYYDQLCS